VAWHRFSTLSLGFAALWFVATVGVAAVLVMRHGSDPSGWNATLVAVPLAVGWVIQALVGAWTHLVPSIGAGSPERHAIQRGRLARAGTVRLLLLNGGCALVATGPIVGTDVLVVAGIAAVAASTAGSIALLLSAVTIHREPYGRATAR
jgi:hypothetical protein